MYCITYRTRSKSRDVNGRRKVEKRGTKRRQDGGKEVGGEGGSGMGNVKRAEGGCAESEARHSSL